jgi:cytochrome b involved in lipid metabolism
VYDVTPFMEDHPGGDEVLLSATGMLISFEKGMLLKH